MFNTILGLFTGGASPLAGGLLGIAGSIVSSWMNFKNKKLDLEEGDKKRGHELAMRDKDLQFMQAETTAKIEVQKEATLGKIEELDASAYAEGQKSAGKNMLEGRMLDTLLTIQGWKAYIAFPIAIIISSLFGFVDFLRTFMRPGLTIYHVILTSYVTVMAWNIVQEQEVVLTHDEATQILVMVINMILFLTVTCVTWWFSDRMMEKHLIKSMGEGLKN